MQEYEITLLNLIEKLKTVDTNKTAPYLVKEIDKHVQEAYANIYKIRETKLVYKPFNGDKTGHCC
jgi:putative methionine-R-sulfoxide reductase with GAF domain